MIRINCKKCLYYFVTWNPENPHGCKAYGFKSKQIPSLVVKSSTGKACQSYTLKNTPS
ncbi:uracil-DNA glycosylase [Sulfurimonas sp. MAG313]|nr:uracil-DNA glycosylase [Sulfurimonas sp. MAG313]MDF1881714.1 uracil-DNA glycosylase [Sulfurimonas sp. MAG313]